MLAIARALMARPKVLLLDEPSMGLAPLLVEQIFATLRALKEQNLAILLVEQFVTALDLADEAHVLKQGQIVLGGPAAEVAASARLHDAYLGRSVVAQTVTEA